MPAAIPKPETVALSLQVGRQIDRLQQNGKDIAFRGHAALPSQKSTALEGRGVKASFVGAGCGDAARDSRSDHPSNAKPAAQWDQIDRGCGQAVSVEQPNRIDMSTMAYTSRLSGSSKPSL